MLRSMCPCTVPSRLYPEQYVADVSSVFKVGFYLFSNKNSFLPREHETHWFFLVNFFYFCSFPFFRKNIEVKICNALFFQKYMWYMKIWCNCPEVINRAEVSFNKESLFLSKFPILAVSFIDETGAGMEQRDCLCQSDSFRTWNTIEKCQVRTIFNVYLF